MSIQDDMSARTGAAVTKRQGVFGLAANDKGREQQTRSDARAKRGGGAGDAHVAEALRSAYEQAVREDVPAEFLDLLGKLS